MGLYGATVRITSNTAVFDPVTPAHATRQPEPVGMDYCEPNSPGDFFPNAWTSSADSWMVLWM